VSNPNIIIKSASDQPVANKPVQMGTLDVFNIFGVVLMGLALAYLIFGLFFGSGDGGIPILIFVFVFVLFPVYFVLLPIVQIVKLIKKTQFSKIFPIYYYEISIFVFAIFLIFLFGALQDISQFNSSEGEGFPYYFLLFLVPLVLFGLNAYFLPKAEEKGNLIGLIVLNIITIVSGGLMIYYLAGTSLLG
jgi:hypothetical protein